MRILLILVLCFAMIGCSDGGEVKIPKKTVTLAEANEAYDIEKFAKINIPRNCKVVGIAHHGLVLLENSSGTQFIFQTSGFLNGPKKIIADMPELW